MSVGGRELTVTARREQVLLAMLLLHAETTVSVDLLVEAVWGDRPPTNAHNQVQGCVSRLRKRLTDAGGQGQLIVTDPTGYRMASRSVDVIEFRRLLADARAAAAEGRRDDAIDRYRAGLGLWRGSALVGIDSRLVQRAGAALAEERLQALEECIRLELAAGRAGELVIELTSLVQEHPYREALHGALMLALYRAGRQADALAAFRHVRQLTNDELGAEPGDDLQRLHRAILNRDPTLDPPDIDQPRPAPPAQAAAGPASAAPPKPRQLPADLAGFIGRAAELDALEGMRAGTSASPPSKVVISAITGSAGVGKTALAVHWAHQVADRFPDGQLYIDLRGFAAAPPIRPIEALAALLRSLGTPADQIPVDQAQAAALYRTQLADKRTLVILDNAGSVEQVRPLLPGSPGCAVLVTSRDRLSGLIARDGARRLTLDVLTLHDARALLAQLLGSDRVDAEPSAAAGLARACAHLPLALRIAAAHLADHPHKSVADYVVELGSGDRLAALQTDGDEDNAVRAALDLSYHGIPASAQRLFRMLGLVPGEDLTETAAAALADTTVDETAKLLGRLVRAHLVDEHASGRYTFHDLLRLYAKELADTGDSSRDRSTAMTRLLGCYLHSTHDAVTLLYPQMMELPLPPADLAGPHVPFTEPGAALAWLDVERANLVAAVVHAAGHGPRPLAWQLAGCLRRYFLHGQHTLDWETVANAASAATHREGDLQAQAAARLSVADLKYGLARYSEAVDQYTSALDLARRADWREGELAVMANVGRAYRSLGKLDQAADCFAQVLSRCQQIGSLNGQAANGNHLGVVDRERGRLAGAADRHAHALVLYRQLGYQVGQADTETCLGAVHHELGRLGQAHTHLTTALALHRELGDRGGAAMDLESLAAVQRDAGNLANARQLAEAAVAEAIDDRGTQASALSTLGSIELQLNRPRQAVDHHRHALDLARQTGARRAEAAALLGIADAQNHLGLHDIAAEHAWQALGIARSIGYLVLEGRAKTALAEVHLRQLAYDQANGYARHALENHRGTGHRLGEARTLAVLGRIAHATDDATLARSHLLEARMLFAEIGAVAPAELSEVVVG